MLKQPHAQAASSLVKYSSLRTRRVARSHAQNTTYRQNTIEGKFLTETFNDVQGVADLTEVLRDPQHLGKRLRLLSRAGHGHDNVYNTDWFLATQKPESSTGSYTLLLPQCVLIFHKIIFQMKSL